MNSTTLLARSYPTSQHCQRSTAKGARRPQTSHASARREIFHFLPSPLTGIFSLEHRSCSSSSSGSEWKPYLLMSIRNMHQVHCLVQDADSRSKRITARDDDNVTTDAGKLLTLLYNPHTPAARPLEAHLLTHTQSGHNGT